ncbi:MAG: glutamine-hydrolyzing GMP synthase [Desulfovibrio sp.]|nr:glutamine-hydrolyzing GMP synthase [Desulfovibrio sp.]
MPREFVLILDYGSQVTQLIARSVRELGVYSEIHPWTAAFEEIQNLSPAAIILSGGPASALAPGAPAFDKRLLDLSIPLLGICYGMQVITLALGGELSQSETREYGPAKLVFTRECPLWKDIESPAPVWMSHGDAVSRPAPGFEIVGSTETIDAAAIWDRKRNIFGTQFHPEVRHTVDGRRMIANFLFEVAGIKPSWTMASFINSAIENAKAKIGDDEAICALSGGIDSTVTAALLNKAIGKKLRCVFVDNGLLRLNEGLEVPRMLREYLDLNLTVIDASRTFLGRLEGVADPERKRKIIGETFIEIFEDEAKNFPNVRYLAQGTLYPDVIESVSRTGSGTVIKSHHNVGGLPEKMNLKLIEPLRELFKDEVRQVAAELGLPESFIKRHPFPGPGLAIRILGPVASDKLEILRAADNIVREELRSSGQYDKIWQGFAVLLPLLTVGVMGDDRTYEHVIALRCVDSADAMTADWSRLPYELLARISSRVINEVKGVNRVVYDISSKPPATIEWE